MTPLFSFANTDHNILIASYRGSRPKGVVSRVPRPNINICEGVVGRVPRPNIYESVVSQVPRLNIYEGVVSRVPRPNIYEGMVSRVPISLAPVCADALQTLARTADIRVSERGPLTTLRLLPHPPVYNELTGEVCYRSHQILAYMTYYFTKAGSIYDRGTGPELV